MAEGPIATILKRRGATLSSVIRMCTLGYYWIAVLADRHMTLVDWWEAFNEAEAREKAKAMLYRYKERRPDLAPFTVFLIQTTRWGERAFLPPITE
jgi:hypothetical protein